MIPLIPDLTFNDSRSLSEVGLRHNAQIGTLQSVRQPNGEYIDTWVFGTAIPCRMTEINEREATIAAAEGVKFQWILVFKQTAAVEVGNQAMVRGTTDGVAWQRLVEITSNRWMTGRVQKKTTAVDVDLSP